MKTAHARMLGQILQTHISRIVFGDEILYVLQFSTSETPRKFRCRCRLRVIAQQVNGENVSERLRIQTAAESLVIQLTQQRKTNARNHWVDGSASFDNGHAAGNVGSGGRALD